MNWAPGPKMTERVVVLAADCRLRVQLKREVGLLIHRTSSCSSALSRGGGKRQESEAKLCNGTTFELASWRGSKTKIVARLRDSKIALRHASAACLAQAQAQARAQASVAGVVPAVWTIRYNIIRPQCTKLICIDERQIFVFYRTGWGKMRPDLEETIRD